MSFAALFAGAAMAAEPTKTLESIENVESFDVASGEYVQVWGAYYRDGGLPDGTLHKGPVVNVGSMSIDGIFEVKASDQNANRLYDVKKVSGAGEIRFGRGVYISQESNFSNFGGTLTLFTAVNEQGNRKGSGAYFLSGTNNPSNINAFNLEENTELSFTNGDYTLNGKIEGAGTISARTLENLNFEGDKILENAAPANVVIKGDISNFSGSYVARESSSIKLETKLADKVAFVGDTGGTLELAGAAGDARKTITIDSSSDTTTSGNVFMYGNKAIIANNSRAGGAVDANSGTIYFGGNHEYTQADLVNHTFDKTTVLGDSAGNVVMGGKGAGALTAKGISAKVDGVKIGTLVIGGADGATVEGDTRVIVNSGEIGAIYGGMGGIHNGATTIEVNGGKVGNIYGADGVGGTVNGNIYIHVKDANVEQLYGSNYHYDSSMESKFGGVKGNVSITVDGNSKVGQIRGGINTTAQESEAIAKEKMVLDGNVNVNVKGNAVVGDGSVAIIGGGGSYGSVKEHVSINISENATVKGDVFAGANSVDNDTSGNLPYVGTNTYLSVNDNATVDGNLFGGSRRFGVVKNNTSVSVNGGTVTGSVYGGGQQGSTVEGMTVVRANGGVIEGDIYGGGRNGGVVNKQTYVQTYEGATVAGNVYGGGENDTVKGNTQIEIYGNSDIKGDIYGGGKGADSKVLGSSSIRFVSNSNFTGTVDGAGQDGGTVAGTRRLTFGGWQEGKKWDGDFNGKIKNINSVVLTNGSKVSNLRFDMTEPMSFGGEGTLEVITNLVDKNIDTARLVEINGSSPLDITFKNSTFSGNEINNNFYGVFTHWGAGKMAFDGTTIKDNSITRNDGEKIQGILYYNGSGSGEVVNTVLENNTVSATQVQSSGVFAYKQDLDIKGSKFIGNKSIGSDGSKLTNGAVYVENQSDTAKIVNISDTIFDDNSAENTGDASMGKGGALAVVKRFKNGETLGKGVEVVLNDATFTNNSAGMGGAIYVGGETLTLNATKSATFSGNTATSGGFLYMDNGEAGSTASAKVSLNVADGATLTIGTTGGASDSIAGVESATLSKLGAGALDVNGSMADFKGSLIVSDGVMNANNGIGANSVSIENGATLGVALGNGALENASVVNNGTLSLKQGTLADGEFVLSNYSGEGALNATLNGGNLRVEATVSGATTVDGANNLYIADAKSNVTAKNIAGDVEIDNVAGAATLEKIGGNVTSATSLGSLDASNVTGSITAKDVAGTIKARGIADISAETAASLDIDGAGNVDVSTVNGTTNVANATGLDIVSANGNVTAKNIAGDVKIDNVAGAATLENIDGKAEFSSIVDGVKNTRDRAFMYADKVGTIEIGAGERGAVYDTDKNSLIMSQRGGSATVDKLILHASAIKSTGTVLDIGATPTGKKLQLSFTQDDVEIVGKLNFASDVELVTENNWTFDSVKSAGQHSAVGRTSDVAVNGVLSGTEKSVWNFLKAKSHAAFAFEAADESVVNEFTLVGKYDDVPQSGSFNHTYRDSAGEIQNEPAQYSQNLTATDLYATDIDANTVSGTTDNGILDVEYSVSDGKVVHEIKANRFVEKTVAKTANEAEFAKIIDSLKHSGDLDKDSENIRDIKMPYITGEKSLSASLPNAMTYAVRQQAALANSIALSTVDYISATRAMLGRPAFAGSEEVAAVSDGSEKDISDVTSVSFRSVNRLGDFAGTDGNSGANSYSTGGLANLEYIVNRDLFFGISAGGAYSRATGDNISAKAESTNLIINLYGDYQITDGLDAYIGLTYSYGDNKSEREAAAGKAKVDYESDTFGAFGGLRYTIKPCGLPFSITPLLGVNYSAVLTKSATEKEYTGPDAMSYAGGDYHSIRSLAGFEAAYHCEDILRIAVSAMYAHEFLDNRYNVGYSFDPSMFAGSSGIFRGSVIERDYAILGFGINGNVTDSVSVGANYNAEVSVSELNHHIGGYIRFEF